MADSNHFQVLKAIERDNVITYKRKGEQKNIHKSATDDQDVESASSLKSANLPLPELQKDRRKLLIKPFGSNDGKNINNFIEKQVRQHDNILLKQRNNMLTNENMKLRTKITVIEKENEKLQRILDNEQAQVKPNTVYNNRQKLRPADSTLRAVIRGLRKQIEDQKKQNMNIKSTVKFTSLKELETERDHLAQETIRLRMALEEEQTRRSSMKVNFHGVSALEHRLQNLTQRNSQLNKQHSQLLQKYKKLEESVGKSSKSNDLKNALANARKVINQKQNEIQLLKSQLKTSSNISSIQSIHSVSSKQAKFEFRRPSIDKKNNNNINKTLLKPQIKSAAKIANNNLIMCQKCPKLDAENRQLIQKCKKLEADLEKLGKGFDDIPRQLIQKVTKLQENQLKRFLILRFKAHRLTHQESQKYLINCQGVVSEVQLKKDISVRQLMQSLFVEPFCIVSNRYLEILIVKLIYGEITEPLKLDQDKRITKKQVLDAYLCLLPKYEIMSQQKQQEMFIQVAELITTYYQQILAALTAKRNGDGTISQGFFLQFFKEIELEQEYIDFIITQIILQSLDMEHLNYYAMFQIFYMPQMAPAAGSSANPNIKKKKFEVEHQNVVHQEDQEYQESKSHLGRNKTLEQRQEQDDNYEWEQEYKQGQQNEQAKNEKKQEKKENPKKQEEQQYYEQEYEEQKMNIQPTNQSKVKQYVINQDFDS